MNEPAKDKNNLFILALVAIVAIVVVTLLVTMKSGSKAVESSSSSDLVGQAGKIKPVTTAPVCEDTDGLWTENKGTTTLTFSKKNNVKVISKEDECFTDNTGTYIREYYCASSSRMESYVTSCYYGCSDGACLPATYTYSGVTVGCYDGYETTINGDCASYETWSRTAFSTCQGHCITYSNGWQFCLAWWQLNALCAQSGIGTITPTT